MRNGTERRRTDRQALAALVLAGLAFIVSCVIGYATLHNRSSILTVQEGRANGVALTCGVDNAIIDAARQAISAGTLLPGDMLVRSHGRVRFQPGRLTIQLGSSYPSYPERVALANKASTTYAERVTSAVVRAYKAQGRGNPPVSGGKVDCKRFTQESNVK